jgi:hypothetical protein
LLHGEVLSLLHHEGFDQLFAVYIEALIRPLGELRLQKLHLKAWGIEGAVAPICRNLFEEAVASFAE